MEMYEKMFIITDIGLKFLRISTTNFIYMRLTV